MKEFITQLSVSSIVISIIISFGLAVSFGSILFFRKAKIKKIEKGIDEIAKDFNVKIQIPLEEAPINSSEREHGSFKEWLEENQEDYTTETVGTISKMIRKADTLNASKDFKGAQEILINALAEDPDNEEVISRLALSYLHDELYFKAETLYIRLLELTKPTSVLYTNLGHSLYFQNKLPLAKEAYEIEKEKAIFLDKDSTHRHYHLAKVLHDMEEIHEAIAIMRSIEAKERRNKDYWHMLRTFYEKVDDKENLKKVLTQLIKMEPFNKDVSKRLKELG